MTQPSDFEGDPIKDDYTEPAWVERVGPATPLLMLFLVVVVMLAFTACTSRVQWNNIYRYETWGQR